MTSERITIDGRLNEHTWRDAAIIEDFVQREPREGMAPSERTEVRLLYDRTALYAGIRCYDRAPSRIVARVMEHDNLNITADDQIVLSIDGYHDHRNGYFFSTNPLGAQVEAQFANEGADFNKSWDGVWQVRATRDAGGWVAEIAIPFSTIGHGGGDEVVMGLNLMRRIARRNEIDYSPAMPRDFGGGSMTVSRGRHLHFRGIEGRGVINARPYVLGGVTPRQPGAGYEVRRAAGFDTRWTIRPDLAVDATVNPDFAQVESDDELLNLTRQSLFVPEKRPFFLENSRMFEAGLASEIQPFFGRRIGLASGRQVPVDGGVRLTGKVRAFEVGLLDMRTRGDMSNESANDAVVRVRREVRSRSAIGFVATDHRSAGSANTLIGTDATVVGRGDIRAEGAAFRTIDRLRGSGSAWLARVFRESDKLAFDWLYSSVDDRFEPALGFLARPAVRQARGRIAGGLYVQRWGLRRIGIEPGFSYVESVNGGVETRQRGLALDCLFETEDRLGVNVSREDERLTRPLTFIDAFRVEPGAYRFATRALTVQSSPVRPISGEIRWSRGGFYGAGRSDVRYGALVKLGPHLAGGFDNERTSLVTSRGAAAKANLYRIRVKFMASTTTTLSALVQYSSVTHALESNARLEVRRRKGGGLYVVLNETKSVVAGALTPPGPLNHAVIVKYTHLIGR